MPSCASTASTCSAAISPSPVVEKSDRMMWPDCSPPTLKPPLCHLLQHIAVAHRRARQGQIQGLEITVQPGIGHHRADHAAALELVALRPAFGDQGQDLVAVDDAAMLVGHHHPVGVAVQRDAEIGAHFAHLGAHGLGRGRAAIQIDVGAVGRDAHGHDVGAQFPQHFGRDLVGGAIGAIDHDAQAVEPQIAREGALGEFDIARLAVVDALGAADLAPTAPGPAPGRRPSALRSPASTSSDSFWPSGPKNLMPLSSKGLCEAVIITPRSARRRARQHGDGGRGQRAELEHIHAHGGEAGDQRAFDHVARQAGILADHHPVAMLAAGEDAARRHAGLHRHLRASARRCWCGRGCRRCRNICGSWMKS